MCLLTKVVLLGLFLVSVELTLCAPVENDEPAVFIISYDAFREEYLQRNITPNMNRFKSEGTSAQYMLSVFPTKTFVNHQSIATGVYPDVHGVLGNEIYDSETGRLPYSYDLFHYNDTLIPIWLANQMAGKHSGCMMWPGCNFTYSGQAATFRYGLNTTMDGKDRIDTAIQWFMHEETPANLVMLYVDELDAYNHIFGTEYENITDSISKLDRLSGYIQQKLVEYKLDKRVNVIHLSDHGMETVTPRTFIDLRQYLQPDTYTIYSTSPVVQIVPNDPSQTEEMFATLSKAAELNGHFKVYNAENIPTNWRIKTKRRTGPILAVADLKYAFADMYGTALNYETKYNYPMTHDTTYGCHGYDPNESSMHAIFMAKGPQFPKGKQIQPFENVHLYGMICNVLDIPCNYNGITDYTSLWNEIHE